MVIGLIPYFRWLVVQGQGTLTKKKAEELFSKIIYRYFTQDAIDRAHGATWNPITLAVDSPQDKEVDDLENADPEFDLSNFTTVDTDDATIGENESRTRVRPHDAEVDDESLSTINTTGSLQGSLPTVHEETETPRGATATSEMTSDSPTAHINLAQFQEMMPALQALANAMPNTSDSTALQNGLMLVNRLLTTSSEARKTGNTT